jgi:hypothetical protein
MAEIAQYQSLTCVVVTSPVKSHPCTELLERVINSFKNIPELCVCPVIIVFDGYIVSQDDRTKKGKVTEALSRKYEEYFEKVVQLYGKSGSRFHFIRSPTHEGFAMAVKRGLKECKSEFAMIVQHDRAFIRQFTKLNALMSIMRTNQSVRYIGFPHSFNSDHRGTLRVKYKLSAVTEACELDVESSGADMSLQPLIFWFDSNHLVSVQRYLQIYTPYKSLTPALREHLGLSTIRSMLLKNGDFIEDRWGQVQRTQLTRLCPIMQLDLLCELFQWYGCYMLWVNSAISKDGEFRSKEFVAHLRGRGRDATFALPVLHEYTEHEEPRSHKNGMPPSGTLEEEPA